MWNGPVWRKKRIKMHVIIAGYLYDIQQLFYPLTTGSEAGNSYLWIWDVCWLLFRGGEETLSVTLIPMLPLAWFSEFGFLAETPWWVALRETDWNKPSYESVARRRLVERRSQDVVWTKLCVSSLFAGGTRWASLSWAELLWNIWVPYNCSIVILAVLIFRWTIGHTGGFQCFILAHSSADFPWDTQGSRRTWLSWIVMIRRCNWFIGTARYSFSFRCFSKYANGGVPGQEVIIRYIIIVIIGLCLFPPLICQTVTQSQCKRSFGDWMKSFLGLPVRGLLWQSSLPRPCYYADRGLVGLLPLFILLLATGQTGCLHLSCRIAERQQWMLPW